MAAMFVAMVWHARRHLAATEKVRRVSEQNERLLVREHAFLQDASHELRTPITIALGHAELVQRSQHDPLVAEDARVVVEELQRLGRLADRLLTLASLEQPGFLRPTSVDLVPFVVELAHRWAPTPRVWRLDELDEAVTRADPDRLQLALDAIVENAVKHTGPQDVISFALHRSGDRIAISVSDTGSGIPPEDLQRIFERFSRSAPDPSSPRRGSGLGLSIAKAVVEAHGGTIDVRSEPAKGTVFRITLPVDSTALPHDGVAREPTGGRAPQSDRASSRSPLATGAAFAEPIADPS
jgi:signal transduction histidine kinase